MGMIRHPDGVQVMERRKLLKSMSWPKGSVEDRVAFAIEEVRPAIQMEGVVVALMGVVGARVGVLLRGACRNCAMAQSTLSDFVAERVKLYAPEITDVVAE
jgi:Fe-S cluster biogenesis protein NfuA